MKELLSGYPVGQIVCISSERVINPVSIPLEEAEKLVADYTAGLDIHSERARREFGDNFTPEQRLIAKRKNFLSFYSSSLPKNK